MAEPIRKRMKRREIDGGIRFITFSCEQRLPLLGAVDTRDEFVRALTGARIRFGFELFAWVVMPEHVHLLLRPAEGETAASCLRWIKSSVAQRTIAAWRARGDARLREITRRDGEPRFWLKGGGFDRNTRTMAEFTKSITYIHLNPVSRGLVDRPEVWRWSSVRWWMGRRDEEVECDLPPGDPRSWAMWEGFM